MSSKGGILKSLLNKLHIKHWHFITFMLIIYDVVAVNGGYFLALWFRFDSRISTIDEKYITAYLKFIPIYTVFAIASFFILNLYNSIWRFSSYK